MSVLVVVPTYNEAENIPALAEAILDHDGIELLVVDDASPDGTGAIAENVATRFPGRMHVLHRTGSRGFGPSFVDGFRWALARPTITRVCQMDADFSHDPKYLPDLIAAASDKTGLVIGSRYLSGVSVVNWPLRRLFLSAFANWYVRTVTGLNIRDCTAGFRCWTRAALEAVALDEVRSDGYSFQVETLFRVARTATGVGEVPIIFVERRQGASKMSKMVILESVIMPWLLILRLGGRIRTPHEPTASGRL